MNATKPVTKPRSPDAAAPCLAEANRPIWNEVCKRCLLRRSGVGSNARERYHFCPAAPTTPPTGTNSMRRET